MFNNLYFIVLLATTNNLCFCYHHKAQDNCHDEIPWKVHRSAMHRRRIPRTSPRQNYDDLEDDGQVAQIDVASFIQDNNEYGPLDSYRLHKNVKKSSKSNKYDKYKLGNDKADGFLNYQMPHGLKENSPSVDEKNDLKDDSLPSSYNYNEGESYHYKDRSVENSEYKGSQKPKKKSGFKLQFPFFSHKSDKAHDKKKPKNVSKVKSKRPESLAEEPTKAEKSEYLNEREYQEEEAPIEKVKKRSYIERVCPACRRKFVDQAQKQRRKKSPKMIHNSRQFFQQLANKEKTTANPQEMLFEQEDMDYDKFTDAETNENDGPKGRLQKRDESGGASGAGNQRTNQQNGLDNRARQLKELEEVERKVENTNIIKPH